MTSFLPVDLEVLTSKGFVKINKLLNKKVDVLTLDSKNQLAQFQSCTFYRSTYLDLNFILKNNYMNTPIFNSSWLPIKNDVTLQSQQITNLDLNKKFFVPSASLECDSVQAVDYYQGRLLGFLLFYLSIDFDSLNLDTFEISISGDISDSNVKVVKDVLDKAGVSYAMTMSKVVSDTTISDRSKKRANKLDCYTNFHFSNRYIKLFLQKLLTLQTILSLRDKAFWGFLHGAILQSGFIITAESETSTASLEQKSNFLRNFFDLHSTQKIVIKSPHTKGIDIVQALCTLNNLSSYTALSRKKDSMQIIISSNNTTDLKIVKQDSSLIECVENPFISAANRFLFVRNNGVVFCIK